MRGNTDKPSLIIVGAGGHAKVLIDTLLAAGCVNILGITDREPAKSGTNILSIPVIGTDEVINQYAPANVLLVNGLGSIGAGDKRMQIFKRFKARGYCFAKVIHPSTLLASETVIGEGAQILAGAIVQTGCKLGDNVILNTRVAIDHDCIIGSHVHIAPGAVLSGEINVGENAHIGTGAVIIQGVNIGAGSVVGGGAAVIRDVSANTTAVGVPAG
ncbi:MAG: acetyltransferase [Gammaproteobacteria bacterium]|nr:acetyltransferase [Gammaproteobacteria bacterium]